jgi:tripartite ATP-independent transporter DctM subunit
MQNDTLLAIPFFTLMGLILERSGMAEDLLDTIGQLFRPHPRRPGSGRDLVGAMLAATTGVVAASVISMGLISLPIMLRYGYDRRLAAGVIAASGTLAQIIPPSLVLIIMADQLGRSVGDMYKGAFLPGLMLTGFYALYVILLASSNPSGCLHCPPRHVRCAKTTARAVCHRCWCDCHLHGSLHLVAKNMPALHTWWSGRSGGQGRSGRNHRGVHVLRRGPGFRCRQLQQDHPPGPAVACG